MAALEEERMGLDPERDRVYIERGRSVLMGQGDYETPEADFWEAGRRSFQREAGGWDRAKLDDVYAEMGRRRSQDAEALGAARTEPAPTRQSALGSVFGGTDAAFAEARHEGRVRFLEENQTPDIAKLLFPAFGERIDRARAAGFKDADILKALEDREITALMYYPPSEVNKELGRTEETMRRATAAQMDWTLDAYAAASALERRDVEERVAAAGLMNVSAGTFIRDEGLYRAMAGDIKKREALWESFINGHQAGDLARQEAKIGRDLMYGVMTYTPEVEKQLEAIRKAQGDYAPALIQGFWNKAAQGVGDFLNLMEHTNTKGLGYGLTAGLMAALAGLPLVAPLSVPISAGLVAAGYEGLAAGGTALGVGAMAGMGYAYGSALEMAEQEGGSAMLEYLAMKDENGQPMNFYAAQAAALTVGLANAVIEEAQMDQVLAPLKGKLTQETMGKLLRVLRLRDKLVDLMKDYAGNVSSETAEEVVQKAVTIIGGEAAKLMSAQPFEHITLDEAIDQLIQEGAEALPTMTALGLPGLAVNSVNVVRDARAQSRARKVLSYVDEDVRRATELTEKIRRGEVAADDVVGEDPVVFVPRDKLSPEALTALGVVEETLVDEDAGTEAPVEASAAPEANTPGEVAVRQSVWDEWAAAHPEEAEGLKDDLRTGTRGVTAAEEAARQVAPLAERARDKLQADTPEAEAARNAAGEVFEQLKELNGNLDTPLEERVLQDQSALYGHYLLAINKKYGVPIEEAHRVKVAAGADPAGRMAGYLQPPMNGDVNPEQKVSVVDLSGKFESGQKPSAVELREMLIKDFVGKEPDISADAKGMIGIPSNSKARHIVHSSWKGASPVDFDTRVAGLMSLHEVLENSTLIESHKNQKSNKRDLKNVHRFYVPVWTDEGLKALRIVAHEDMKSDGQIPIEVDLYDLVVEQDDKSSPPHGSYPYGGTPERQGRPNEVSIGEMLRGVKDANGDLYIYNQLLGVEGPAAETETYAQARATLTQDQIDEMTAGQIEAVRKQYEGTDRWMKAPNGQQTNLTEKQWLQVRTPAFKEWFGDWEKAHIVQSVKDFLDNSEPVGEISGNEFQKSDEPLAKRIADYYKETKNTVVNNKELGDVTLDIRGIKDSLGHGLGKEKAAAFALVPDVIKNGFVYAKESNWKDRGYDTAILIANVKIGGKDYVCEVIVKQSKNKQGFYLHEVEIKNNLEGVFKTALNDGTPPRSRLIISQYVQKSKDASKVVDANGEPLVVYHGSNTGGFSVFNTEGKGKTEGTGAWFTSRNDAAFTYSGTTDLMEIYEEDGETYSYEGNYNYPVFLNIRTPYVMECGGRSWDHLGDIVIYNEQTGEEILEKSDGTPFENEDDAWRYISEIGGEDSRFYTVFSDAQTTDDIARAVRNGDYNDGEAHDGVLFKDINDSGPHGTEYVSDVYVAFNPEQIKSATDNRGTFDAGDADIYRQGEETDLRGTSSFTPLQHTTATISLFQAADASTFLHELWHVGLDDLLTFGRMEGASEQAKADVKTAMEWLGITEADLENGDRMREAHEKWAEAGEQYFMNGHAPSPALLGVFQRFRKWLLELYNGVRGQVELSPEIQGVFDRILAANEEITEAYEAQTTAAELEAENALLKERIAENERQIGELEAGGRQEADDAVEGWLRERQDYEGRKIARDYVQEITKAIRDNGGLRVADLVRELGEELAKDLQKKWPGLFRNTTKGPQLELDVLAQQLQTMGIDLDVGGLVQWLQNTVNETPKRPEATLRADAETLDALMFRLGPEGVRDYLTERKRFLRKQAEGTQDAGTLRNIYAELKDIDEILAGEREAALKEHYKARIDKLRGEKNARIQEEIQKRRDAVKALRAKQAEKVKLRREVNRMIREIRRAARDGNVVWHTHQDILARLGGEKLSRSLKDENVASLRALHGEITELRKQGRRELEQVRLMEREQSIKAREALRAPMMKRWTERNRTPGAVAGREDTGKIYRGLRGRLQKAADWVSANTLGAQRFFDRLDGGKGKFDGAWIDFFVNRPNAAKDEELRHIFDRREWMENKMREIGLRVTALAQTRDVDVPKRGGGKWTVDELISIYAGMKNERSRNAILFGNFKDAGSEEAALSWAARCVAALTDQERAVGDAIIEEYALNVDRIDAAMIAIYNRGMNREENYTPMRRLEVNGKGGLMDMDSAEALMNAAAQAGAMLGVERGFTVSRVDMRPENQTGIDLGLYAIWNNQMEAQEHAAAFGGLTREMRRVLIGRTKDETGPTLRQMVREVYGHPAWQNIQNYYTILATDRARIADDVLNNVSNWFARNMSKAYLAYNLGTCVKQTTSFWRVLPYTDMDCLLGAIGEAAARRGEFLEDCYRLDPQLRNQRGNALIAELRRGEGVSGEWQKFLGVGMDLVGKFDRATSAIVWKAVYDTNIKRGLSQEEAARAAQRAVLLTQPASHAKDLPRLWNTAGGLARLAMLFTNDLAQTFGITMYDLGAALRRGDMPGFAWTLLSVTLAGMTMGFITDGGPDEPDDPASWAAFLTRAFSKNAIETWPIVGKGVWGLVDSRILGNQGGYFSSENPYLTPLVKMTDGVSGIFSEKKDTARGVWNLMEGTALLSPFPATGIKRLWQAGGELAEGEAWRGFQRLVGMRVQEKRMNRRR